MAGVKPSKFINYISEFKKILVTRNNGTITQKFKLDSNITDDYYFSIVNSKNQLVSLTGRNFKIYGSIIDAKEQMHILFYSDNCKIENNGVQMHFNINTFTSQYMAWVKTDRIIDLTIIEVVQPQQNQENDGQPDIETGVTQVILRDQALAYKRPYIEGQTPTQILQKVILTTNIPLTGVFGSGQEISLTDGSNGAAFGTGLDQTGNNQLVIGQYNEVDNTKAFVIGNGDNDSNRKNILTVDYQGNIEANSIDVASAITVNGSPVATDASIANDLSAMSGWANETFETKTNATNSYNALAEDISAVSDAIPTKVSQLTNDKGYITGVNLDGYATEQWVKNQGYLTAVPNTYALKTDIPTDVATSAYVQSASGNAVSVATAWVDGKNYLTAVPNTYALKTDIPTDYTTSAQVSSIVTSYGYITGYNQGTGIKIENGTISVDGGLGQTYYADDNTLQLDISTNTFSIKSLSSKLNQGTNIILTPESDGSVTINAIGGGGGGTGGATYLAGLGLGLSTVSAEDSIYKFYVNQTWLNGKIEAATSGIQNLSAGTGLQIVDNVVSVSAQYLTEVPDTYATKDYVTGAISGKADLSSVYTKEEVYTYLETDVKINEATSGLATKDDLDVVSAAVPTSYVEPSAIENMATTGWVDENYAKIGDTPTDVYTKTEVNQISSAISSAVSDAGYLTEVPNTYALKTDVETASGAAVDVATGWVSSQNYLTEVPSEYITETELSEQGFLKEIPTSYVERDELSAYATNSDLESVSGELVNAIGAKADATALEDYVLTSSMSAYATSAWVDENFLKEHQSLDDYATKELVGEVSGTLTGQINDLTTGQVATNTANITQLSTDFGTATGNITTLSTDLGTVSGKATTNETNISTLSGQVNTASSTLTAQTNYISGVVDTNTTNIGLVDGRVQTIEADYLKAADIAQMATTGYVTGKVNDLATGAVATNTANITQLSTDLGTTSSKLQALSGEVNTTSTTLNNAITGNAQNISTLSTDLGTVSGKANTNETNIGLVSTNLGTLSSELNTTSTFISGKVSTLSSELNTASSTLTAQTNYISGVVDTNTEKITSLSGDVEDLSATVSTFDSRITQMSGKVDAVSGIVDVLSGDVETIKSDYVTSGVLTAYVNNQYVAVSQLANDVGYITIADIPGGGGGGATYTAGYGISIDANNQISLTASIPTSTSQLTNDSQFATSANVSAIVEGYGYATNSDLQTVSTAIPTSYLTSSDIADMATTGWVDEQGYLTEVPNTYATQQWVEDKGYLTGVDLTNYATKTDVSTASANAVDVATGWVGEQGYLTGVDLTNYVTYTLFKATAITNDFKTAPQISAIITGYGYATNSDLQTVSAAIPLSTSQLTNDSGYITLADIPEGTIYGAGFGLALDNSDHTFSLTGTVLSGGDHISIENNVVSLTGDVGKTYTGGTGIEVDNENNTITLTATIPSVEGLASEEYVTGAIEAATTGLATNSDLQIVSSAIPTNAEITGLAKDYVDTLNIATTYATKDELSSKANSSDVYTKGETDSAIQTASGNIETWVGQQNYLTAVPDTYATKTDVSTASGAAVDAATGWVDSKNYLTGIPSEYITETELANQGFLKSVPTSYVERTELTAYATEADLQTVSTAIPTSYLTSSDIADMATQTWVGEQGYLTAVPDTYATKTDVSTASGAAVDAATGWVDNQNYLIQSDLNGYALTSDIKTYKAGEGLSLSSDNETFYLTASIPDDAHISAIASGYAGTTTAEVSAIIEGYNYIQGITVDVKDDQTREDQTEIMFSNQFVYDSQYIKLSTPIPTTVAELSDASDYALTSQLTAYTTSANVSAIVTGYGYQTADQVSAIASGYAGTGGLTSADVSGIIEGYNYIQGITVDVKDDQTREDQTTIMFSNQFVYDSQYIKLSTPIPTTVAELTDASDYALTSQLTAYTTSANVSAIVEGYNYITGYTAGTGIDINNGVISCTVQGGGGGYEYTSLTPNLLAIDNTNHTLSAATQSGGSSSLTGVSELTNDAGFITNNDLTNKQRVSDPTPAVTVINYNPAYEIFKTTYTVTDGAIVLSAVTDTNNLLTNGDVATFEEWITTASDCTANVADGIKLVGEIPDLTSGNYHVFVRRLVKVNGTVIQYVSFAYEAEIPVSE